MTFLVPTQASTCTPSPVGSQSRCAKLNFPTISGAHGWLSDPRAIATAVHDTLATNRATQFYTSEKDFEPRRLWERMKSASRYGDCLLTVATGELAELGGAEEEKIGLVKTHAYAVLQVREACGEQLVQLKNPWARVRWKGAFSVYDTKRWTPELRKALDYDQMAAMQHDNGVFWIDYASLQRFFQGVYLNWNPQLFAHSTTHHGQWPTRHSSDTGDDTVSLGRNPQYGLTVTVPSGSKPSAVWILLNRHTTRKDQGKDDFLTMHVFRGERGGFRVYYLEDVWKQGVYSNRPHCLVQFDLPAGQHKLTLALAQYKPVPHQVDYTIKVYSMSPFKLRPLPYSMRHSQRMSGSWKGLTAGGCLNFDTACDNPRYAIGVDGTSVADLQIELIGPEKFSVGTELHALDSISGGKPPTKPLATSGAYRKGFCLLEARAVTPGKYAITVSTFEPRQEGNFSLVIGSSTPVSIKAMPHEGHGLERRVLSGAWTQSSAAGSPNHGQYHTNPQYRLVLSRRSEVLIRLRLADIQGGRKAALSIDLYKRSEPLGPEEARGRSAPAISANGGVYTYPPGGAIIPRSALDAGTYIAVVSTFDPLVASFEFLLYTERGVVTADRIR